MEIVDNKALVIRTRNPQKIINAIPKSEVVKQGDDISEVAVHWGLDETLVLHNLGYSKAPSPIISKYDWCGIHTPFEHQKETAAFLTTNHRCFVLNEAGTGKTSAAIWAADYLMKKGKVKRVLIIAPLSILSSAWQSDLFKVAMHRTVSVAHGAANKRKQIIKEGSEFVIINYDGVEVVVDEILEGGFDLIISDECTSLKNPSTKRWKTVKKIIKPNTRLWMMTGTPAAQSPLDAYGMAKLVNPEQVPRTFGGWRDMTMQHISQFRWIPKPRAKEIVHAALQPAIRFTKEECLDLPDVVYMTRDVELTPQQKRYYEVLRKEMLFSASGEEVTAVNAATKMGKLLQISCIGYTTPVLTQRHGWIPIYTVTPEDLVWDGEEWVNCGGAVFKGLRETVLLDGVQMTPEHLVLTKSGWQPAGECINGNASEGFNREKVRLPSSFSAFWNKLRKNKKSNMALPLRLWDRNSTRITEPTFVTPTQCAALRVPSRGTYTDAWYDLHKALRDMVWCPKPLSFNIRQGLQKLWWPGHHHMRTVEGFICKLLGGHERGVLGQLDVGSQERQRWVLQRKLSMGNYPRAGKQHTIQSDVRYPKRENEFITGGDDVWIKNSNTPCETDTLRMGASASPNNPPATTQVFDLINCGPRNRFVVRGAEGQHIIVHNCGAVYTDDKQILEFDVSNRMNVLKEVLDETSNKAIVFAPYRHTIELLRVFLEKEGISVELIHGDVSVNKRTDIFNRFQTQSDPKVLVIQPQAASHGVTLTAADNVIFWSPVTSVETYIQCIARMDRFGQKNKMTVTHLQGSEVERKLYKALQDRKNLHEELVALYRGLTSDAVVVK